ncbi:hypothetical protein B0H11DRAFT_1935662 [Mycena galericulata]|nr:hypothetical protein B0H11DRAFT_1935662 [Mycena galericulata]
MTTCILKTTVGGELRYYYAQLIASGDCSSDISGVWLRHAVQSTGQEIQEATRVLHEAFGKNLPGVGIVGVGLWFGPGQKFLSSAEQRNAGWNQTMEVLDDSCRKWWDNVRNLVFSSIISESQLEQFLSLADTVPHKLYGPGQQVASYHL